LSETQRCGPATGSDARGVSGAAAAPPPAQPNPPPPPSARVTSRSQCRALASAPELNESTLRISFFDAPQAKVPRVTQLDAIPIGRSAVLRNRSVTSTR